jgi:hypothetical protein
MGVALGHAVELRLVVAQGAARCPTAVEWTRPGELPKAVRHNLPYPFAAAKSYCGVAAAEIR